MVHNTSKGNVLLAHRYFLKCRKNIPKIIFFYKLQQMQLLSYLAINLIAFIACGQFHQTNGIWRKVTFVKMWETQHNVTEYPRHFYCNFTWLLLMNQLKRFRFTHPPFAEFKVILVSELKSFQQMVLTESLACLSCSW